MVIHDACPVCSGKETFLFLECPDHFLTKQKFKIFRCGKCGFLFTQGHPDESEAGKYYESDDYISHSDSSNTITEKAYQLVRKIMLKRKVSLIKRSTGISNGNILDIGCGTGHFLNSMKLSGWSVTGIEKSDKARNYAESKFNLEVSDTSQIAKLNSGTFDCITMWHVLEHFHEPELIMKEISRLLKPGGLCVIALPNSNSFDANYYESYWAAYDVPRHLWHFSPETFSLFAGLCGFKVTATITLPFDVFYISILSEKYRGNSVPQLAGLIKAKFFFLRSLFRKWKSSSMIYLLKRTDH
jgi:ubiquinone/menaquinone biosynthesis C-methylase UbiE